MTWSSTDVLVVTIVGLALLGLIGLATTPHRYRCRSCGALVTGDQLAHHRKKCTP